MFKAFLVKYQIILDFIIMSFLSIIMVISIDNHITTELHLESSQNIAEWEHQRDSIVNTYFECTFDSIRNLTNVKVNIHNDIIRKNVTDNFSIYPIFDIFSDKSLGGYILLSINDNIYIQSMSYSNYVDTVNLNKKQPNCNVIKTNFITHLYNDDEAIIFNMCYPFKPDGYNILNTVYESMFKMIAASDSAYIKINGESSSRRFNLDSNHIKFISAIDQICELNKKIEYELIRYNDTLYLHNRRYLEH